MSSELKKRIITSIFLLILLILMFFFTYILIISLIIITVISWIEFYALISKIYKKETKKNKIYRFIYKTISLIYLSILVYCILIAKLTNTDMEIFIVFSILISVMSDIGGLIIGQIFKGKKLTIISPKKTISGSIGSFIFSIFLIPFFIQHLPNMTLVSLFFITLVISFVSQIGDLFISYLKRSANVKNTSDLLPGHGGVLDRIDGMIFSIPVGFLILGYF
jgi:phosphatidate cytidylyltransferase|tara:strand:- start:5908 stop:6570 length:663 start_codon:yes stop_codon:yes gene_type:complete